MILLSLGPTFEFGLVEKPKIKGFECTPREGEWLIAVQGFNRFFVERLRGGHRLFPIKLRHLITIGDSVTYEECVRLDQAIFIPNE